MTQSPAINPLPNPEHEYYQGDRIEYTGKTEHRYGAKWYEAIFVEGHRKGETTWTYRAPRTARARTTNPAELGIEEALRYDPKDLPDGYSGGFPEGQ